MLAILKTAHRFGKAPTLYLGIFRERDPGVFLPEDYALTLGLQLYEDMLCPDCHQPSWMSYEPFNSGEWEAKSDIECESCLVMHNAQKIENRPAGQKLYLHNHITAQD